MFNRTLLAAGRRIVSGCVAVAVVFGLLVGIHGLAAGSPSQLATVVRCNPTTATGVIGVSDAAVDMYVEDVADLNAVDLQIASFDTAIAQVVSSPSPSGPLQPLNSFLQPDFVVRNIADNTAGTIRFATTQTLPNLPVDGSGPLARITFHGLGPGTFTMTWGRVELADADGQLIPATTEPCTVVFNPNPSAIALAQFYAEQIGPTVRLTWETVSEVGNLGFNLYRSLSPAGSQLMLNASLIPAQAPGSSTGFTYTYRDQLDLVAGETYYYWLEDQAISGATTLHGPVLVTVLTPTAVTLSGISASAGAGTLRYSIPVAGALLVLLAPLVGAAWARRHRP